MKKLNFEQKQNTNGGLGKCGTAALTGAVKGAGTAALSSTFTGPFGVGGAAVIGAAAGSTGGMLKAGC